MFKSLFHKRKKGSEKTNEFLKKADVVLKGFSSGENSLVDIKTLRSLIIEKWYYLENNAGRYKLVSLTEDEATFVTEMNEGGSFGVHHHDGEETGIVVEGHLIDDINNLKVLKGETFKYNKNQSHKPYCRIKSIYEVSFT